jgi:hypothetical protein
VKDVKRRAVLENILNMKKNEVNVKEETVETELVKNGMGKPRQDKKE